MSDVEYYGRRMDEALAALEQLRRTNGLNVRMIESLEAENEQLREENARWRAELGLPS